MSTRGGIAAKVVRRLTAATLMLALLAPGWFPLTALTVDGTHLLRSDHGCVCGRFSSCCCEMVVSKAERARRAQAGETGSFCHYRSKRPRSASSHSEHTAHGAHTGHAAPGRHAERSNASPEAASSPPVGPSFCDKTGHAGEPPEKRAATLDFRSWVGPLTRSTPQRVPELSGHVLRMAERLPLPFCDPPETPPPRPSSLAV